MASFAMRPGYSVATNHEAANDARLKTWAPMVVGLARAKDRISPATKALGHKSSISNHCGDLSLLYGEHLQGPTL